MGPLLVGIVLALLALVATLSLTAAFYRRVGPDEALVVSSPAGAEPRVAFSARLVFPVLHRATVVSLREHAIALDQRGDAALHTQTEPVELLATFRLRVNRTTEDVLKVSGAMGEQASDPAAVRERFAPMFREALETVARTMDAHAIEADRSRFKEQVIDVVGRDLEGFVLVDVNLTGVSTGQPSPYRG